MKRQKCIVTGKNGQLGRCLQDVAIKADKFDFLFFDRFEFDITNGQQVAGIIKELQPDYIINTAAYTAVDKAENEQEAAYATNAEAVGKLAFHAFQNNCFFIHISTDYVFDGTSPAPYKTLDLPHPVNYYGYSKWQGETLALYNNPQSIIIRTSWVYSEYGNNFVKTMMRLMQERKELSIVNDQTGAPTYAGDLATAIISIISHLSLYEKSESGIYHFANSGKTNWFDFAATIRDFFNYDCHLNPIPTSAYPTPAKRPLYSLLDTSRIKEQFDLEINDWGKSLKNCLIKMR